MALAPRISTEPATDLVEELRLRRWARANYVPVEFRDQCWEACVLDEMQRKDQDLMAADDYVGVAQRIVPLVTEHGPALRGPHRDVVRAQVLARVPFVE
ncbi:MAG TPA: hypothetical protein VGH74_01665 [Planctomycetaceae bacterium]